VASPALSVVVTGAGRGIGRAIAETLSAGGWRVVGVEREREWAVELGDALGAGHAVTTGDVTDRAVLEAAAARACELAPLGGWVNNAGLSLQGTLHDPVADDVARVLDVNVSAVFWGCSIAVRTFLAQGSGGAIANVSSVHGRAGFAGWAAYDTSKGAVEALTRHVAVAYGPVGIRANAVAPGTIAETPAHQASVAIAGGNADDVRAELAAQTPLRRLGAPREVAGVVAFLLSAEAAYVTGQVLGVDGGLSASVAPSPDDPSLRRIADGLDDAPEGSKLNY
jgi:NAD(P)-dependent dehydrogenase (short-subunit alcohol dehydrogenase family)